ncbi:MAG: signal peptidase II [Halioglobus sp.]
MSSASLRSPSQAFAWYALALVVLVLDLASKRWASEALDYGRPVEIFSWFNITLHHNAGAAFSFLSDAGGWQRHFFAVVATVISTVLVVWLYRLPREQKLLALSLALILGGALGNLWDRVTLGYVVDFISVHYAGYYFPTFNLADSAITAGAGCMILDTFLSRPEKDGVSKQA